MKIVILQYVFGIPSMRKTIKEIEVNLAYRWYLGYGLYEDIPHFLPLERTIPDDLRIRIFFKDILPDSNGGGCLWFPGYGKSFY